MPARLTPSLLGSAAAVGLALLAQAASAPPARAQGLVQGVEQGARAGNKAAGPVGGVLGGAIGGVVGVVGGVIGGVTGKPPTAAGPIGGAGKAAAKPAAEARGKAAKRSRPAATGQEAAAAAPLTAEQIVADSDANIARLKRELNLTPEQEKHWGLFTSAMHYLGQHGAERFNLRKARAQRDPPDDIIEQMRNEAQFLYDRGADQRAVADAAEPLFASLDERQKAIFVAEMVRLSYARGLD